MKLNEIKCYGIAVNTRECYNDLTTNNAEMMKKCLKTNPVGVYPDTQRGYQLLIYKTAQERNQAYKSIAKIGFEDFCKVDDFYVKREYIDGKRG